MNCSASGAYIRINMVGTFVKLFIIFENFIYYTSTCAEYNTKLPDALVISTLKAPSKICCRQHSIFFYFSKKISLGISCELSDGSHEISRLFSMNYEKKKKK